MAKKKTDGGETVNAPAPTTGKRGGPRGPRGIKLILPSDLQRQLDGLPDLYPSLKKSAAQEAFLAHLWQSGAFADALNALVNELEDARTAKVNALRGVVPEISPAPDQDYAALDDETAQ